MEQKDNPTENKNKSENTSKQAQLNFVPDSVLEQIGLIRSQIQNARLIWQDKTTAAIDNVKQQLSDFTKRIESDIDNIKGNVEQLENELFEIQDNVADHNITFMQEVLRKAIHFTSLSIPISYIFFGKEEMLMVLVPLTILVIAFDIATKRNPFLRSQYLKIFGFMLRRHEIKSSELLLNGASWVMIAAVVTIYFFPPVIAIISLSVLFISDVTAAIIGRKFGKRRFLNIKKKSLAGTIAFMVSATIIGSIYGGLLYLHPSFYIIAALASMFAAFIEAISAEALHIDDNLTIPISFGLIMWTGSVMLENIFGISIDFVVRTMAFVS